MQITQEIDYLLDNLCEGIINKLQTDLLRKQLQLYFYRLEDGEKKMHSLLFEQVASFYFSNGPRANRFKNLDFNQDSLLSYFEIGYLPQGVGEINIKAGENWTKQWLSSANFYIEMDPDMILFIEAGCITIDGLKYKTGFPELDA